MIFDYYIDFKYLAEELSSAKKERRSLIAGLFLRIIDICVLENGRLLVDENRSVVKPLEEIAAGRGSNRAGLSAATENLVATEFLNKLPPNNSIPQGNGIRIYVSVGMSSGPDVEKMSIQEIHDLSRLTTKATVLIDREHPIEKYFNFNGGLGSGKYDEKARAYARDVLTYSFDLSTLEEDHDPSVLALKKTLASFGAAETNQFEIFDKYGFRFGLSPKNEGAAKDAVKLIKKWLNLIVSAHTSQSINVNVYAMVDENDIKILNQDKSAVDKLTRTFETSSLTSRGKATIHLKLAPLKQCDHSTACHQQLCKAFHDRRVCSTTHSFSIGGGLDVLQGTGGKCLFELHYCGRRGRNVQEPRLQMIRDYFNDPAHQNEVFTGKFTIPGINH